MGRIPASQPPSSLVVLDEGRNVGGGREGEKQDWEGHYGTKNVSSWAGSGVGDGANERADMAIPGASLP